MARKSALFNYPSISLLILIGLCAPFLSYAQTHSTNKESSSHKMSKDKKPHSHWDYLGVEGPQHWGLLTKEYAQCETGSKQSPINIQTKGVSHHQESLIFNYKTSELHEINNGHTIQVSHTTGCHIAFNKHIYNLRQFHFHEPSEHHIDGKAFPMEMHFVHQDKTGKILVVAVMMQIGDEHPIVKNIWKWLPDQVGQETSIPIKVSLRDILPQKTHHYSYSGSLTTPPCTEGVQWIVLTETIKISEESLKKFTTIIGPNARPVQPLGSRHIDIN
jgi:carbonic anhydrase